MLTSLNKNGFLDLDSPLFYFIRTSVNLDRDGRCQPGHNRRKNVSELDPETRETIVRIIKSCVYGDLATICPIENSPRVRPVCAFLQDDLSVLIPSHTETRKIAELEANPRVEICFVDSEHWQVRVAGTAVVVEDASVKKELIETTLSPQLWHGFFPDAEADERFVLYRIEPKSFEWMKEWEMSYRRVEL